MLLGLKTRFRVQQPDYSYLPEWEYDCSHLGVYGNVREKIPEDIPKPLGKSVTTTAIDANWLFTFCKSNSH